MMRISRLIALIAIACAFLSAQQPNSAPAPQNPALCEHANPPRGMHWECPDAQHPCNCKLAGRFPTPQDGSPSAASPVAPNPQQSALPECKNVAVEKFVAPEYPESARAARVEGNAMAEAYFDSTGAVTSAAIIFGEPHIAAAAQASLAGWKISPQPTACRLRVHFQFTLDDKSKGHLGIVQVTAHLPASVAIVGAPARP